eukprot:SM000040S14857  [mRNA]  locus=s40:810408:813500:- [translate_table: standard]
MWEQVVGRDSEDDEEGPRTAADDDFIDDEGVEPAEGYADDDGDGGRSPAGDAPQAEEAEEDDDDDDLGRMFKPGKGRRKRSERTAEETAMLVDQFMTKLEVAAEEDADANRRGEPAVHKLRMLPELKTVLDKRLLQQEFLDRGILTVLKNWLEPLPDGSLPNINTRSVVLKLLLDLPIDVELYERREQLKKSGLGKVVMFLSRVPDEIPANRRIANDLVQKWSRPIFQKSTRWEDLRKDDIDRPSMPKRKPQQQVDLDVAHRGGDDLDLDANTGEPKPGQPGYYIHARVPEKIALDFVVRPESRLKDEQRQAAQDRQKDALHAKLKKKMQQIKSGRKKSMRAEKISLEGRGLVKYI